MAETYDVTCYCSNCKRHVPVPVRKGLPKETATDWTHNKCPKCGNYQTLSLSQ